MAMTRTKRGLAAVGASVALVAAGAGAVASGASDADSCPAGAVCATAVATAFPVTQTATATVTATATQTVPGPTATVTVPGPTTTVTASPSPSATATTPTPTVPPTSPPTTAPPTPAPSIKVGVYPDNATLWPANGITNVYLQANQAGVGGTGFPMATLKALLVRGVSLNITITAKGQPYVTGIIKSEPVAMAWANAYVGNIATLSNYAASLKNGTYVVATAWHESVGQIRLGKVTDTTDVADIGRAQQILIRLGKVAAPNAQWSVWLVGFDRTKEAAQLAQVTSPKPDLITWDPYANHDCGDSLTSIGADDAAWIKAQPAYNGALAISETGMTTTCTDSQLAKFYSGLTTKAAGYSPALRFVVTFNSDNGDYDHLLSANGQPLATSALQLSLAR